MQVTGQEFNHVARCRRVYAHAHDYHINSISNNRLASFMILRMFNQIWKKICSCTGTNVQFPCLIFLRIVYVILQYCLIGSVFKCILFFWHICLDLSVRTYLYKLKHNILPVLNWEKWNQWPPKVGLLKRLLTQLNLDGSVRQFFSHEISGL